MTAFDAWGDFDKTVEEATKSSKPVPAGEYNVTIFEAEIVPFTKKDDSPYAGLKALSVQLRISDGDQTNRRLFDRVGLFPKFQPTQKNPQGSINHNFFNFFQKALGWDADKLKSFALALKDGKDVSGVVREIQGAPFTVKTKVDEPDEWNPEGRATVTSYLALKGAAPTGGPAIPSDAWAAAPASQSPAAAPQDPWGSAPKADPELAAAAASSAGF